MKRAILILVVTCLGCASHQTAGTATHETPESPPAPQGVPPVVIHDASDAGTCDFVMFAYSVGCFGRGDIERTLKNEVFVDGSTRREFVSHGIEKDLACGEETIVCGEKVRCTCMPSDGGFDGL